MIAHRLITIDRTDPVLPRRICWSMGPSDCWPRGIYARLYELQYSKQPEVGGPVEEPAMEERT